MPKMKTHRGAAKRFKRTGTGKLKRFKAFKSHMMASKSQKRVRRLRKATILGSADHRRISRLLND